MSPVSWGDIFTLPLRGDRIMELRHYRLTPLPRSPGMCYNLPAVQPTAKQAQVNEAPEPDRPTQLQDDPSPATAPDVHASCYCPVCSRRLESRRCKLICTVCGYYMSCADYY